LRVAFARGEFSRDWRSGDRGCFVFASEIVVEVGSGEVSGGGDFAHAGFGEAAGAEFTAGGAQNFEAAGEVAALEAGGAHGDRMAFREVDVNEK